MSRTYTFTKHIDTHKGGGASTSEGRRLPLVYECVVTPDPTDPSDDGVATTPEIIDALGAILGIYFGTGHPDYPACRCVSLNATIDDAVLRRWTVPLEFEEPAPSPGTLPGGNPASHPAGSTDNPAPADKPASFVVDYQRVPFSKEKDRAGKAYKNAAGDWLENPPQQTEGMAVFKVRKYYAVWDIAVGGGYIDNINAVDYVAHTVTGNCTFPAYACRIEGLNAELKTESGYIVWEVNYVIHAYTGTRRWFPLRALNIGRNVIQGGVKVPAASTTTGRGFAGLTLLNADGTKLPDDALPTYTTFDQFTPIDFAAVLGI